MAIEMSAQFKKNNKKQKQKGTRLCTTHNLPCRVRECVRACVRTYNSRSNSSSSSSIPRREMYIRKEGRERERKKTGNYTNLTRE
jgi:hypothetical protein